MQLTWASTGPTKSTTSVWLMPPAASKTKQVLAHTPQAIAEYFTNLRQPLSGTTDRRRASSSRVVPYCSRFCSMTFWCSIRSTRPRWPSIAKPSRRRAPRTIPRDAEYAAELLMKHNDRLKAWHPDDDADAHAALSGGASAPADRRSHAYHATA